jgi:hypothetical protein
VPVVPEAVLVDAIIPSKPQVFTFFGVAPSSSTKSPGIHYLFLTQEVDPSVVGASSVVKKSAEAAAETDASDVYTPAELPYLPAFGDDKSATSYSAKSPAITPTFGPNAFAFGHATPSAGVGQATTLPSIVDLCPTLEQSLLKSNLDRIFLRDGMGNVDADLGFLYHISGMKTLKKLKAWFLRTARDYHPDKIKISFAAKIIDADKLATSFTVIIPVIDQMVKLDGCLSLTNSTADIQLAIESVEEAVIETKLTNPTKLRDFFSTLISSAASKTRVDLQNEKDHGKAINLGSILFLLSFQGTNRDFSGVLADVESILDYNHGAEVIFTNTLLTYFKAVNVSDIFVLLEQHSPFQINNPNIERFNWIAAKAIAERLNESVSFSEVLGLEQRSLVHIDSIWELAKKVETLLLNFEYCFTGINHVYR